jgi:hypothetical protein
MVDMLRRTLSANAMELKRTEQEQNLKEMELALTNMFESGCITPDIEDADVVFARADLDIRGKNKRLKLCTTNPIAQLKPG